MFVGLDLKATQQQIEELGENSLVWRNFKLVVVRMREQPDSGS